MTQLLTHGGGELICKERGNGPLHQLRIGAQESGRTPEILSAALNNTELGGLQGITAKLQQGGLGREVESWVTTGGKIPVTAEQLRAALSDQHVQQIARELGLPVDQALQLLAQHLPDTVDKASRSAAAAQPS
jgi:uncharacterized protein YidB (DUF937 family)